MQVSKLKENSLNHSDITSAIFYKETDLKGLFSEKTF